MMMKGNKLTLNPDDEVWTRNYFKKMYLMRGAKFGNARDVRNVLDKAKKRQAHRLLELQKVDPQAAMQQNCIITKIDICDEDEENSVDQILEELDAFVGMDNIKIADYYNISLSSIETNAAEITGIVTDILYKKMNRRGYTLVQHVSVKSNLILRNSVKKRAD